MDASWTKLAAALLMATGLSAVGGPTRTGEPVSLTIAPNPDKGAVEIAWPSRPDSIHTLLISEAPGGAGVVDARLVPGGPDEVTRAGHPVDGEAAARFFRLKTRSMVPVVADDFDRPGEGPQPLGTPPLGDPWTVIGLGGALPGRHGVVENGDCLTDLVGFGGVTYLCQELPSSPCLLEADFRWEPHDGTGVEGVLTIACSPSNQPNWIDRLVHVRIFRTAVYLDFKEEGRLTNHVRSAVPELPLHTSHNCRIYLDMEAQAILIILNGQTVVSYRHPAIERLGGRFVFWEHYYNKGGSELRLYLERVLAAVP